ncbi:MULTISPECIES: GGDEF domain-containing protein [Pseudoalteromonas]|uniref:GGDEF domain-containing protein n=1 Tax=Pseudoalteromonas TaxID=53246 RepID=UPI0018F773AB|nr:MULTISPECIES: GGDEF domain-containing protein [unclassified Pseudoalteromonas]MCF2899944.1 GGDEF domain-containing protein [Pseudoalteromonas sp. OFAV1]MCF2922572.1 GGDEF domain-containing protein [Pseudoalteromonas sp. APAL1]
MELGIFMVDLPTIISISVLLNVVIGAFLLSLYFLRQQQSYLYWGSSCLIFVLAQITATSRVFIDLPILTHFIANLLIIAAPLAAVLGIHAYNNREKYYLKRCLYLLLATAMLLFPMFQLGFDQFVTTAILAFSFLYAANALRRLNVERIIHLVLLQLCFFIHSAIMFVQFGLLVMEHFNYIKADISQVFAIILISHIIITTLTAMIWPLLMFLESEQVLSDLANRDSLTGLLNRRAFITISNNYLEQANNSLSELCAVMIDIDFFKRVNDKYGHETGDEALKWVANKIKSQLREHDLVARIGGEEFAVILPSTNQLQGENLSERIRLAINNDYFTFNDQRIKLTISVGIITHQSGSNNINELLAQADKGLYKAKVNGRNQVVTMAF